MQSPTLNHGTDGYVTLINKKTLEFMQRRDRNGITFDGPLADCDVCAVGKSYQLAHPKKAKNAEVEASFQVVYGDLMEPFTPAAYGGYRYVNKITDQFSRWPAVYLFCSKNNLLLRFKPTLPQL